LAVDRSWTLKIAAPSSVQTSGSRLVPSLRYRDVAAAIDWLCRAFGFEERQVVAEADGTIRHAQLSLGNDLILLLPALPLDAARIAQSSDAQSLYFVVEDPEAHYAQAEAGGAEVVDDGDYAFGGHGYSCRDPEGHVWHFGTFNPRQDDDADGAWIRDFLHGRRARHFAEQLRERFSPPILAGAVVATIVAAAAVAWMLLALTQTSASAKERGLAFKTMWQTEEPGVRALARLEDRLPTVTPEPQAPAPVRRVEEAHERPSTPASDAARLNTSAFASGANSRRGDEMADRMVRLESERSAEEAVKKARSPQRTALQVFSQQRTARKAAVAAQAREQQLARERAGKEAAAREAAEKEAAVKTSAAKEAVARAAAAKEAEAKAAAAKRASERSSKEASNWSTETERAKPTPAPVRIARPQQEQSGERSGWECTASEPSGQLACNPAKKPAGNKAASPKQNLFETTSETVPASVMPQPQAQRQAPESDQAANAQVWDCQPTAPTGDVVCRPVRAQGGRTNP
jgi:uncharacterized glyoxalase superfamily protein PhnB